MILSIMKLKEMKKGINKKLSKIKIKAYELYKNKQIPKYLFECICRLGTDTSIEEYKLYIELVDHYTRISGYYGRYADIDYNAENSIKEILKNKQY